jgi:hypothetical protein
MRWSGSSDKPLLQKFDTNSVLYDQIDCYNRNCSTILWGLSKSFLPVTMTLAESIAKDIIHRMDKQERERFVALMLDEFFRSMTLDERKEIMTKFIPDIVSRAMEGMSLKDRKVVVEAAISVVSHPEHHGPPS